jgi:putative endonuclease
MFYVYILKSLKTDRFYVGYSQNPETRLTEHNSGKVASTRNQKPWIKLYQETFDSEILAITT